MEKPVLTRDRVKTMYESRFVKVYGLEFVPGKLYMDATRRSADDLMALKSDEEFKQSLPDAVSCFVVIDVPGDTPKLLLSYEFRYVTGQFLLSVPAGLIDPEDREKEDPLLVTAVREIQEETGVMIEEGDELSVVSPLAFSTPGMTDESNGLVSVVLHHFNDTELSQDGALGGEKFNGFELVDREHALRLLQQGRDDNGNFYSIFTWASLMYFLSDMWKDQSAD